MREKEQKTEEGQLPDFISDSNGGYFFNICWNEGDGGNFQYETKWAPNTGVLQQIAARYGADFVHDYEEAGSLVYGRAAVAGGQLTHCDLDAADFEACQEDGDSGCWIFEGGQWESQWEILEVLLERKIAGGNP